ncbi:MAG: tRNA-dihydrouridine synthase, partial [Rhodobacteraceae bacterium]|nr:tRNA-dihydrouridine synthase [Paracoccaceae bacterium]
VGRGAQGAPWVLGQIAHALYGTPAPQVPQGAALCDLISAHYEDMLGFYGIALGLKVARKHLGWYLDRAGAPKAEVVTASDPAQVLRLIRAAVANPERHAA